MAARLKRCVKCKISFLGSIDPSGMFCSTSCKLAYCPTPQQLAAATKAQAIRSEMDRAREQSKKKRRIQAYQSIAKLKREVETLKRKKKRLKKNVRATPIIPPSQPVPQRARHPFYDSEGWRRVRYQAIRLYGGRCQACSAKGVELHVDHIKPRSKFPELSLELSNLQVLCRACNLGKGAWDQTDWRGHARN